MEINESTKKMLADFLDDIREYVRESGTNLAYDERKSIEFVEIYNNKFSGGKKVSASDKPEHETLGVVSNCLPEINVDKLADNYIKDKWDKMDEKIWREYVKYERELFIDGANAVVNGC